MLPQTDILIITALKDELDALLDLGPGGKLGWEEDKDTNGFPHHHTTLATEAEGNLRISAAWAGSMGETAAADRSRDLIAHLKPTALGMCGICAGRRGEVFLGDAIVADRVFSYDNGKLTATVDPSGARVEEVYHDVETYNLRKSWATNAVYFAELDHPWKVQLSAERPISLDAQRSWLMRMLLKANSAPVDIYRHADRVVKCPDWPRTLASLEFAKYISTADGALVLTAVGTAAAKKDALFHPDGIKEEPPFRIHVGPIATGKTVRQDPELFSRIARYSRKVLGVEMEAAAIGYVAERAGVEVIIVKSVSDYGDNDKDDGYRKFACRSSATLLLEFLRKHPPPRRAAASIEEPAEAASIQSSVALLPVASTNIVNGYAYRLEAGQTKGDLAGHIARYLRWLKSRTETIELRGIESGGSSIVRLQLSSAYVPLLVKADINVEQVAQKVAEIRALHPRTSLTQLEAQARQLLGEGTVSFEHILALGNRISIIGGPGCGKTTVLSYIASTLAGCLLQGNSEAARALLGVDLLPYDELPLPVFVSLASFAKYRRELPKNSDPRLGTLMHFVSHDMISRQADFYLPSDFFARLIEGERSTILLLDGLDEVPTENERADVRQCVEDLASGRTALRIAVTCRTMAYYSGRTAFAGFRELEVQPLDFKRHITPMVRQAYQCIYPTDEHTRRTKTEELLLGIKALEEHRRFRRGAREGDLVNSPLMVRLLLIVHFNNRTLPDERAELFERAVNALLQMDYGRDEASILDLSRNWRSFRELAQCLAFNMHQMGESQGREITAHGIRVVLAAESQSGVEGFIEEITQRGGVMEERDGTFRFVHLAIQEFLVARYLKDVMGLEGLDKVLQYMQPKVLDPWWREPFVLFPGYMALSSSRGAKDFVTHLSKLDHGGVDVILSAAELAGQAALDLRELDETTRTGIAARIAAVLREDDEAGQQGDVHVRARASDMMGMLGDPRFSPQHYYLASDPWLGFIQIPKDPGFRIGLQAAEAERLRRGRPEPEYLHRDELLTVFSGLSSVGEFFMSRYPVTGSQFRQYVEHAGLVERFRHVLDSRSNRPVTNISWYESRDYCMWLDEMLRTSAVLSSTSAAELMATGGWCVDLPSDDEWERAARGDVRDAIFPWGSGPNANPKETAPEVTVGKQAVPTQRSRFGLRAMTDSVLQWTRTMNLDDGLYGPGKREDFDIESEKLVQYSSGHQLSAVIRGGPSTDARTYTERSSGLPSYRSHTIGFRTVLRRRAM